MGVGADLTKQRETWMTGNGQHRSLAGERRAGLTHFGEVREQALADEELAAADDERHATDAARQDALALVPARRGSRSERPRSGRLGSQGPSQVRGLQKSGA